MSSHHIVRDNQEPSIIIIDNQFEQSILEGLLEWGGKLIVLFNSLEKVLSLGFKVDEVICSIKDKEEASRYLLHQYPHYKIHTFEEEDSIETLFTFLERADFTSVNILGNTSSYIKEQQIFRLKDEIVFYQQHNRIVFVEANKEFKKWLVQGSIIQLQSLEEKKPTVNTSNLTHICNDSYKVLESAVVTISPQQLPILVSYSIEKS